MRLEVEVGAVRDALELGELRAAEVEAVLDVDGALRVVRELLLRVLEEAQVLGREPEVEVPVQPRLEPVLVPLLVGAGLDEELHLHLLELARAEDEVAGRDLVAEGLADLADAERRLLARGAGDVGVVDEDALRGLRAQVVHRGLVLHRAEVGGQQTVEVARLGELALHAAVRAVDAGEPALRRALVLVLVRLDELVLAEPLVARRALGQRVDERLEVTRRRPHLRGEDHRGVEADDVVAALHDRAPPLAAHVLLELDAEGAVVPGGAGAAVDLAAGEHEPPALGEVDDGVDAIEGHE